MLSSKETSFVSFFVMIHDSQVQIVFLLLLLPSSRLTMIAFVESIQMPVCFFIFYDFKISGQFYISLNNYSLSFNLLFSKLNLVGLSKHVRFVLPANEFAIALAVFKIGRLLVL
jgi:hypothetical protein